MLERIYRFLIKKEPTFGQKLKENLKAWLSNSVIANFIWDNLDLFVLWILGSIIAWYLKDTLYRDRQRFIREEVPDDLRAIVAAHIEEAHEEPKVDIGPENINRKAMRAIVDDMPDITKGAAKRVISKRIALCVEWPEEEDGPTVGAGTSRPRLSSPSRPRRYSTSPPRLSATSRPGHSSMSRPRRSSTSPPRRPLSSSSRDERNRPTLMVLQSYSNTVRRRRQEELLAFKQRLQTKINAHRHHTQD